MKTFKTLVVFLFMLIGAPSLILAAVLGFVFGLAKICIWLGDAFNSMSPGMLKDLIAWSPVAMLGVAATVQLYQLLPLIFKYLWKEAKNRVDPSKD